MRNAVGASLVQSRLDIHVIPRIKRRSAFVKHLQRHGIDPRKLDINVIASGSTSIPDGHSCFRALPPHIPSEAPHSQERESSISSSSKSLAYSFQLYFVFDRAKGTDSPLPSCSSLLDPSSILGSGFSSESSSSLNPPSSGYSLSTRYTPLDQANLSASVATMYPHEVFFGDISGQFEHGNGAAFPWVDCPLFPSLFGIPTLDASSDEDSTFTRSQTSSPLSSCSSLEFPNFLDHSDLPPNHAPQNFFFGTQ